MTSSINSIDPTAWFERTVGVAGDRLLVEGVGSRSYSYADADDLSLRFVSVLRSLGVEVGDRVAVQVNKSPEAFVLYLACLRGGFVFVPLNTAYTAAEVGYFVTDADPKLFVASPDMADIIKPVVVAAGVRHFETLGVDANGSLLDAAKRAVADQTHLINGDANQIAALLYTSGTTGRSKGAMLTRGNLASNAAALAEIWHIGPDDVILHALPIFHAHGLFIAGNTALATGSSMRFLDGFNVSEVIANMARSTVFMGVPTHYTRLLSSPELTTDTTRSIRLFISGSAPLLAETHQLFEERTGHRILERYAMTETIVNTSNPYDRERKPGAVGFPLPDVEVRLSAPESGEVLEASDAVGMIEIRGPNRFAGYWRNPDKTAQDIRPDGFFRTGDLGQFDPEGYLHIVGRAKDLIISGGYNVYPIEVEAEINALPGVKECTVIGLPHSDFGEAVTAVVITEAGANIDEKAICESLNNRLARYKQPKRVLFVDEFPRNALGKIQKNLLRVEHAALFR